MSEQYAAEQHAVNRQTFDQVMLPIFRRRNLFQLKVKVAVSGISKVKNILILLVGSRFLL